MEKRRINQGDESPPNEPPNNRLTVAQAADQLDISEGAVRSRIKRGTLRTVRDSGTVYVVLVADEPQTDHTDQSEHSDQRLISSYESRIESLERQLAAERRANEENRRIIAGLVQRIPELEAPPQSAQEAQDVAERASKGESGDEGSQEPRATTSQASERSETRPWWRRIFSR